MSYYKYATYGILGLGAGISALCGYYIATLETIFDQLKNQVLDPNASESEGQKLSDNLKSGGGDGKDRLSSHTIEGLKSELKDPNSLREGCRTRYKFTFKSLFESIDERKMTEVRSVCVMTKSKTELQNAKEK